jgi:hypothetical protein
MIEMADRVANYILVIVLLTAVILAIAHRERRRANDRTDNPPDVKDDYHPRF